jgi:hypothetical protein
MREGEFPTEFHVFSLEVKDLQNPKPFGLPLYLLLVDCKTNFAMSVVKYTIKAEQDIFFICKSEQ